MHDDNSGQQDDIWAAPVPYWAPGMLTPRPSLGGPGARSGWYYSPELGQAIADGVADGVSIHQQRVESPDTVPPATIVMAWKRQFPAFGLAMQHAERVRADLLVEQALVCADNARGQPARVALMVGQRMAMAERLDRARWGRNPDPAASGLQLRPDVQPVALEVSDEALAQIATGGGEVSGASVEAERVAPGG